MKIVVSSTGMELTSNVDPRFGRCRYLVFCDTDTGEWEAVPNDNINASGGAGIRTAQKVLNKGGSAVITGNVGPNAMEVFTGSSVPVYTGINGTVESAISLFREGGLTAATGATAGPHAGMRGGGGGGRGKGRGSW